MTEIEALREALRILRDFISADTVTQDDYQWALSICDRYVPRREIRNAYRDLAVEGRA